MYFVADAQKSKKWIHLPLKSVLCLILLYSCVLIYIAKPTIVSASCQCDKLRGEENGEELSCSHYSIILIKNVGGQTALIKSVIIDEISYLEQEKVLPPYNDFNPWAEPYSSDKFGVFIPVEGPLVRNFKMKIQIEEEEHEFSCELVCVEEIGPQFIVEFGDRPPLISPLRSEKIFPWLYESESSVF